MAFTLQYGAVAYLTTDRRIYRWLPVPKISTFATRDQALLAMAKVEQDYVKAAKNKGEATLTRNFRILDLDAPCTLDLLRPPAPYGNPKTRDGWDWMCSCGATGFGGHKSLRGARGAWSKHANA